MSKKTRKNIYRFFLGKTGTAMASPDVPLLDAGGQAPKVEETAKGLANERDVPIRVARGTLRGNSFIEEFSTFIYPDNYKADDLQPRGVTGAAKRTKPAKEPKATMTEPKPPKEKKMSCLDAAAKVLGEQGKPMTSQEMIEEMSRKKYWTSPNGATPNATLYAAILREITTKRKEARFEKAGRGQFALAKVEG